MSFLFISRGTKPDGTKNCLIRELESVHPVYEKHDLFGSCSFTLDTYQMPDNLAYFTFKSTKFGTLRVLVQDRQPFFVVSDLRRILKLSQTKAQQLFYLSWRCWQKKKERMCDSLENDAITCDVWCANKAELLEVLNQMPTPRYTLRRYLDEMVTPVINESHY